MKKTLFYSGMMLFALCLTACNVTNPEDGKSGNGTLVGKFSVSLDQQVSFSQGNLQYQPSTQTWQFAEKQYDVVGESNIYLSPEKDMAEYDGFIDLFIWGSGTNDPLKEDYEEQYFEVFKDWGANKISNGGKKANKWRTLTMKEWSYLFFDRQNADKLRGHATVEGVQGYVFLPDNWTAPDDVTFVADVDNLTTNVFTEEQWKILQTAGAVFLPDAGIFDGEEVYGLNELGYYWSATPSEMEVGDAYCSYIYSKEGLYSTPEFVVTNIAHCINRYSVRLVRNL